MRWWRTVAVAVCTALVVLVLAPPGYGAGDSGSCRARDAAAFHQPAGEADAARARLLEAAAWRADPGIRWADASRGVQRRCKGFEHPRRVARRFAEMPASTRKRLGAQQPGVIGNLDGAPPRMRYAANRVVAGQSYAGRKLLAFDPRGRGRVAEVIGNLERADRIVVVVPGASVDLHHFDGPGRPGDMARVVATEARRHAPGTRVAVVAWAGYQTPTGTSLEQARDRLAVTGAAALRHLLGGVAAHTGAPITVIGHSYGSVVIGLAAPFGHQVHDVVVLGSPGMRLDNAAQVGAHTRLWAARGPADWTRLVPEFQLGAVGHGADPTDSDFGARRVPTDPGTDHSGYLKPHSASAAAVARVATGHTGAHDRRAAAAAYAAQPSGVASRRRR